MSIFRHYFLLTPVFPWKVRFFFQFLLIVFLYKFGAFLQVSDKNSKVLYGVVNIGYNPTLKQELSLEVHILDFDREVYGEKLYIQIVKFMREEKKFSSIDELKATIQADVDRWKLFKREMKYGRTSSKS